MGGVGSFLFCFCFQGEELEGLSLSTLEELQSLHMDALTKLCQAKVLSNMSFSVSLFLWKLKEYLPMFASPLIKSIF
jgi:hypothetical protein